MFDSPGRRARSVALLAVAGLLTVAGVAAAEQGEGSQPGPKGQQGPGAAQQGPPPLGLPAGMTYAQVHVDHDGQTQVISLEQGKVVSVGESSITVRESDGTEATITVDQGTEVLGKPGAKSSIGDVKDGQLVVVCGPEGGAAKTIMIVPKGGQGGGPGGGEGAPGGEGQPQAGPLARGHKGRR